MYIPPEIVGEIGVLLSPASQRTLRLVSSAWNAGIVSQHAFCDPNPKYLNLIKNVTATIETMDFLVNNGARPLCWPLSMYFIDSCENGHLATAKWLAKQGANIHICYDISFVRACENGHLPIAKWLKEQGVDILIRGDEAFIIACEHGRLEVVMWLVEQGVDIHIHNDVSFLSACYRGHLPIAKWLKEQGVDIHTRNDEALVRARLCGWSAVERWLREQGEGRINK